LYCIVHRYLYSASLGVNQTEAPAWKGMCKDLQ